MANPDKAQGFRYAKGLFGGGFMPLIRSIKMDTAGTDTTNNHGDIYQGDPIKETSDLALPADSGDAILGVAIGFGKAAEFNEREMFDPDDLTVNYGNVTTASTDTIFVYYIPAELALFEIQSASDLDAGVQDELDFSTDAGEAHGSRTTGISSAELVADTNSDVVVVEIPEYPDNDSTLANTRYWVRFRNTVNLAPMPTS